MVEQEHLAVLANMNSIKYSMEGNRDAWLALYAEDAVICDPVGVSPLDRTGEGHRGKAAIAEFWDKIIGPSNLTIRVEKRWTSGDYVCCVAQIARNDLGGGNFTDCDMLALYEVDESGLIKRMQAHWNWDDVAAQLENLKTG